MQAIRGTVKSGQISLSEPIRWPEGTEVRIKPIREATGDDDDFDDDPETIARWIAEFEAIPALQMTPAEEAEWQAALRAQRELEKANYARRVEGLGSALG